MRSRVDIEIALKASGFSLFEPEQLSSGQDLEAFLQQFANQPFVVRFKSHQSDAQPQLFTTLLHGNETSGLEALRRLINNPPSPICDTYILVASVKAAATSPHFFHRMLPGMPDLNRCFKLSQLKNISAKLPQDYQDITPEILNDLLEKYQEPEILACRIWRFIENLNPRWLIDLHNTSGLSPAFTVIRHYSEQHILLCKQFSPYIVRSSINIGALFELHFPFPCVTIECGGTGDELSHQTAYTGIHRLMLAPMDDLKRDSEEAKILNDPIRLEVRKEQSIRLTYQTECSRSHDMTLLADIDRFNFANWDKGQTLGWASESGFNALTALDEQGQERIDELFQLKGDQLQCKTRLHLFMITNRVDIAISDCLLYAVKLD